MAIQTGTYVGDSHYSLGGIYRDQGRLEDAIAQYNLTIQTGTYVGKSYYHLGNIYQELSNRIQQNKPLQDRYLQLSVDNYRLAYDNVAGDAFRQEAMRRLIEVRGFLDHVN